MSPSATIASSAATAPPQKRRSRRTGGGSTATRMVIEDGGAAEAAARPSLLSWCWNCSRAATAMAAPTTAVWLMRAEPTQAPVPVELVLPRNTPRSDAKSEGALVSDATTMAALKVGSRPQWAREQSLAQYALEQHLPANKVVREHLNNHHDHLHQQYNHLKG